MDLAELRVKHPLWTIKREDGRLFCQYGAFRFHAASPDKAHEEIVRRETPMTVEQLGRWLAEPGF